MNLEEFKKKIDSQIDEFIDSKIMVVPDDKDYLFLKAYFSYLKTFIKDGKRIRPFIAYITYLSFGGIANKKIINFLIFIEIFHYFCLTHDDIMDNSEQRHGLKTINLRFSPAEAILIGDYLFSWAWEIILAEELDKVKQRGVIKLFNEMIDEVFLGQALDVHTAKNETVSEDLILKKTLHKTAGYTFVKPMLIGLTLANKYNYENEFLLQKIGRNLGLAFQLQDDLLDITSDFNGKKTSLKDVSEGTHTHLTSYVTKNGTSKQKELLKKSFGKKIFNIKELRNMFYESGAVFYGEKKIREYLIKAKELSNNYKYFLDFIDLMSQRNY